MLVNEWVWSVTRLLIKAALEVNMVSVWSQSLDRNGDKVRERHVWAKSSLK